MSCSQIRALGCWKSDAFHKYVQYRSKISEPKNALQTSCQLVFVFFFNAFAFD